MSVIKWFIHIERAVTAQHQPADIGKTGKIALAELEAAHQAGIAEANARRTNIETTALCDIEVTGKGIGACCIQRDGLALERAIHTQITLGGRGGHITASYLSIYGSHTQQRALAFKQQRRLL